MTAGLGLSPETEPSDKIFSEGEKMTGGDTWKFHPRAEDCYFGFWGIRRGCVSPKVPVST